MTDAWELANVTALGADRTMIAPRVLRAAGVAIGRPNTTIEIRGATGTATLDLYAIESLQVGTARVGPLMVVAHDMGDPNGHGLLGRDIFDLFKVTIDNAAGRVTLSPK